MADYGIFSRVTGDEPSRPKFELVGAKRPQTEDKSPQANYGVFSRIEPEPSFGQRALEVGKGFVKEGLGIAENISNIAGIGIPRLLERPEEKKFRERITTPRGPEQKAGATTADVASMFVPIPGLQEIQAPATAGRLARLGMGALRGGVDVGAKTLAQTGSPTEAAKTAAISGPVGAATEAVVPALGRVLNKWAKSQYSKVLHPLGRKAKEVAEEHLPDIVKSGYRQATAATREGLAEKFNATAQDLGKQIAAEYTSLDAVTRTKLAPIHQDIERFINDNVFSKAGAIKDEALGKAALEKWQYIDRTLGPHMGTANPSEVWEIRQALDRYVYKGGLTADESVEAGATVRRAYGNFVRDALNKQHPSVATLNEGYHRWRSAASLMDRNITNEVGKFQFARNAGLIGRFLMGAAVGGGTAHEEGSPVWGTATAAALAGLAFESTGWRTVSAVTKSKIADLLAKGEGKAAAALAARATGVIKGQVDRRMNRQEEQ